MYACMYLCVYVFTYVCIKHVVHLCSSESHQIFLLLCRSADGTALQVSISRTARMRERGLECHLRSRFAAVRLHRPRPRPNVEPEPLGRGAKIQERYACAGVSIASRRVVSAVRASSIARTALAAAAECALAADVRPLSAA